LASARRTVVDAVGREPDRQLTEVLEVLGATGAGEREANHVRPGAGVDDLLGRGLLLLAVGQVGDRVRAVAAATGWLNVASIVLLFGLMTADTTSARLVAPLVPGIGMPNVGPQVCASPPCSEMQFDGVLLGDLG